MNNIYRIIWSHARQAFVVASELATSRGKRSSTVNRIAGLLGGTLLVQGALAAPAPDALPTGGQVAAGQATISQSAQTMTVNQGSDKAIINWQSFNIGADATVNFQQPGSSSVALNRVVGSDPSAIYGSLNANGQVFLVNPRGVLFGQGARVDVGGLVASTLNQSDEDFLAGRHVFNRDGATGSVVNEGELYGKYIALLAPEVRNEGVIAARQGTVALAGGEAVTLNIAGNQLIGVQVEQADIDTLVANKRLIQAEGGTVILSAQSAQDLVGRVVNTGEVAADGISTDGGVVRLLASSDIEHSGSISADAGAEGNGGSVILTADLANPDSTTTVSGSISARGGSVSGDGGFIETSASHLSIADGADIDASAANGQTGEWLLDPYDFTIAASGGDISGATLSAALASNNVTIETTDTAATCTGATCVAGDNAGNGDILVNDAVSWTSARTLTLSAWRDVVVNETIDVSSSGGLVVQYDTADVADGRFIVNAPVNLAATSSFTTKEGSDIAPIVTNYTVVTDQAGLAAMAVDDNMVAYALGKNIAATGSWTPVGNGTTNFAGRFEGLGHVIDSLDITSADGLYVGLFGATAPTAVIKDIALTNVSASGKQHVGALAGLNQGFVIHATANGSVTGTTSDTTKIAGIGGLIGTNTSIVELSSADVTVTGQDNAGNTYFGSGFDGAIGGLIGIQEAAGFVSNSYATGSVTGIRDVGGLIGFGGGFIKDNYAAGSVTLTPYANGGANVGGLIGDGASIDGLSGNNFWDIETTGQLSSFGGIATGKTTAQMKTAATFSGAGWDTRFWNLVDGSYPSLSFSTPSATTAVTLTIGYMSKTYGDANPGSLPTLSLSGCSDCISLDSWGSFLTTITDFGTYAYSTADLLNLTYNTGSASDYTLTYSGNFEVKKRPITLSASKVYDATSVLASVSFDGLVTGESLNYSGATASDFHVATAGKYISAIDITDGTGKASNYSWTLDAANAPVTITPRTLTASLTNSGVTKVYDGTTAAPSGFTPTWGGWSGFITSDTSAAISYSGAAYNDADVADANQLTLSGLAITSITGTNGSQKTDYQLDTTSKSVAASITKKSVTLTAPAITKIYDGNTSFTPTSQTYSSLSAMLGTSGDAVSGITLAFDTPDVETGKTVSISGAQLTRGGVDVSGNYVLGYASADVGTIGDNWNVLDLVTAIKDQNVSPGQLDKDRQRRRQLLWAYLDKARKGHDSSTGKNATIWGYATLVTTLKYPNSTEYRDYSVAVARGMIHGMCEACDTSGVNIGTLLLSSWYYDQVKAK